MSGGDSMLVDERAPVAKRRWWVLTVVCMAMFMGVLDSTSVYAALPEIAVDLGFAPAEVQWVITAYGLAIGGLLLLGGRLADHLGRRRVFMTSVGLFAAASLACGLAGSSEVLIVARVLQGIGAAVMTPAGLSILMNVFPDGPDRNKALGIWGGLGGTGASAGLLLGGVLTDWAGWAWIFFTNVPVCLVVMMLCPTLLPESPRNRQRLDLPGAVTATGALTLMLLALFRIAEARPDGVATAHANLRLRLTQLGRRQPGHRDRRCGRRRPADRGDLVHPAGVGLLSDAVRFDDGDHDRHLGARRHIRAAPGHADWIRPGGDGRADPAGGRLPGVEPNAARRHPGRRSARRPGHVRCGDGCSIRRRPDRGAGRCGRAGCGPGRGPGRDLLCRRDHRGCSAGLGGGDRLRHARNHRRTVSRRADRGVRARSARSRCAGGARCGARGRPAAACSPGSGCRTRRQRLGRRSGGDQPA